MKNISIHWIALALIVLLGSGCADFLTEKNETDLSVDFIYSTPEGIMLATNALYPFQREKIARSGETAGNGSLQTIGMCTGDDITFTRAGEGNWAGIAWYDPTKLTAHNLDVNAFWEVHYQIIAKANEVIYYAKKLSEANPGNQLIKQALGEAACFRAQAYFNLLRRFDNIYLTTEIVTPYNVDDTTRVYKPAAQAEVIKLIKADLDDAIAGLDWTTNDYGRYTQGAARHMKALVAMWPINGDLNTMDLNEAILQTTTIINSGYYSLLPNRADVFKPAYTSDKAAKVANSEMILVEQWSKDIGGAPINSSKQLAGHRMAATFLTRYDFETTLTSGADLEQGGLSWGRIYPNDYLLSLYDKQKDTRYTAYYQHHWKCTKAGSQTYIVTQQHLDTWLKPEYDLGIDLTGLTAGQTITLTFNVGDIYPRFMSKNYALHYHPSSTKYFDKWAREATGNVSFKDIVVYRLAETYLIAAEAYLRKGDMANALAMYNATWIKAGNATRTAALTLQDILDEDARELAQEGYGHRWYLLKRFGMETMKHQIGTYAGEKNVLNQLLWNASGNIAYTNMDNYNNYFSIRGNFINQTVAINGQPSLTFMRWPIPYKQIQAMGGNYPQNPGYVN